MIIAERARKADKVEKIIPKDTDLLNADLINSRAWMVRLIGGDCHYDLEEICIETGCLAFYVSGKRQIGHIGNISKFIDWDGNEFEIDDFYMEGKDND